MYVAYQVHSLLKKSKLEKQNALKRLSPKLLWPIAHTKWWQGKGQTLHLWFGSLEYPLYLRVQTRECLEWKNNKKVANISIHTYKKMQHQKSTTTLPPQVCKKPMLQAIAHTGNKGRGQKEIFFIEWTLIFIMYLSIPAKVWVQNDVNRKKEQQDLYTCFKVRIFMVELKNT